MVRPFQNKSQYELLAEFDVAFGAGSQNPTAYRSKDATLLVLPSELKISDVITSLGLLMGERYLLTLSHLYFSGLLRKKVGGKKGNFLAVHHDILRRLGGENYKKLLDYGIAEQQLVQSPKKFIKGKQSNAYMLNQETFSLQTQQRYELTSKTARRIRSEAVETAKTKFVKTHPVYRKIAAGVDGLTFDYSSAIQYVANLPDGEDRDYRRNAIERLLVGMSLWMIDQQKRNYTVIVNVPKDVRRFFYYGKEPLYMVDITSSHPLLHVLVYSADCPEKARYQSIVESGKFLQFMNDAAGKPFNLSVPTERDELKVRMNSEVFYSHPEPKAGVKKLMAVTFKKEFPVLWSEIDLCKVRNVAKAAGEISRIMQETEAGLVVDAVEMLIRKPYPLMTIHDAIVTTKNGVGDVQQALKQSFNAANLNPALVVKQLSV